MLSKKALNLYHVGCRNEKASMTPFTFIIICDKKYTMILGDDL